MYGYGYGYGLFKCDKSLYMINIHKCFSEINNGQLRLWMPPRVAQANRLDKNVNFNQLQRNNAVSGEKWPYEESSA